MAGAQSGPTDADLGAPRRRGSRRRTGTRAAGGAATDQVPAPPTDPVGDAAGDPAGDPAGDAAGEPTGGAGGPAADRAAVPTVESMAGEARRVVLRGARWPGDVAIADGYIDAVGQVAHEAGDLELRCDGDLVTAGLVNTHHHLFQGLTRGRAVDRDLFGWLAELYPVWRRIRPADVAAAALVGLGELALSGCTTV